MVLLDNGKFLTELHKLYEANKTQGTVWVTLKRSECRRAAITRRRHRHRALSRCPHARPPLTHSFRLQRT